MLTHYRELLRQSLGTILVAALIAGAAAFGLSLLLLRAMPIYESSVTLNMQPSTEDLQFNSAFMGVSQFNPATIIAQTHIERILSRPVIERAVDIVLEQSGGAALIDPPNAFDRFRAGVFRWLRIMNSGFFAPPTQREAYVGDLRSATSVEIVEGSYILLVTVAYTDPVLAARAANALAQAYVDHARDGFARDAAEVDRSLDAVVRRTENRRADLVEERRAIELDLGVTDIPAERTNLLSERSAAREALQEARIEIAELRTRLTGLQDGAIQEGDADLARQFRQGLVAARASIAATEAQLDERRANLGAAEDALRDLDAAQEAFADVDRRIAGVDADLAELQDRRVQIELAREARLSQVRTISEARVPVYPSFPKVLVNTIVGTVLGAILATVPILAMDVLGDRIRTSEDLRGGFGSRVLPSVTPRLRRQARRFLRRGGRPSRALRRYAEQMGRQFVSEGPRRWPAEAVRVTATGSPDDVAGLATVMRAVIAVLGRQKADGSPLDVEALPPMSRIADWGASAGRHVVVGIPPGEATHAEIESIAAGDGPGRPATFATLVL